MMRHSLTRSLVVFASVLLVIAVAFSLSLNYFFDEFNPAAERQDALEDTAADVVQGLRFNLDDVPVAVELRPSLKALFDVLPMDVMYQVVDSQGEIILASKPQPVLMLPPGGSVDSIANDFDLQLHDVPLRVTTIPVQRHKKTLFVQVARSERIDAAFQEKMGHVTLVTAFIATAIALAIFFFVVVIIIKRMLRSLRSASQAAAQIKPTNLTARLEVDEVPAEIKPLIESFNAALERLENGYRIQQEFLSTAAHELKTPLALMRGQIELEGVTDRNSLLNDLDHMARQVHQLLQLAEVSDARNFTMVNMNLERAVVDTVSYLSRLTQARGVIVETHFSSNPIVIFADRGAFFVLLRNLVENATHHTPDGGQVSIKADETSISVRDQGPGIATQDFSMLFKRFWRGVQRRDEGSGLGLSICHEIAERHGWTIAVENLSSGAEFKVLFNAKFKHAGK